MSPVSLSLQSRQLFALRPPSLQLILRRRTWQFFHAKESFMSKIIPSHVRRAAQALIVTLLPALAWSGPVDINSADAATIAKERQGIGMSRAQAIVAKELQGIG